MKRVKGMDRINRIKDKSGYRGIRPIKAFISLNPVQVLFAVTPMLTTLRRP
jgi:hypothetical protein